MRDIGEIRSCLAKRSFEELTLSEPLSNELVDYLRSQPREILWTGNKLSIGGDTENVFYRPQDTFWSWCGFGHYLSEIKHLDYFCESFSCLVLWSVLPMWWQWLSESHKSFSDEHLYFWNQVQDTPLHSILLFWKHAHLKMPQNQIAETKRNLQQLLSLMYEFHEDEDMPLNLVAAQRAIDAMATTSDGISRFSYFGSMVWCAAKARANRVFYEQGKENTHDGWFDVIEPILEEYRYWFAGWIFEHMIGGRPIPHHQ